MPFPKRLLNENEQVAVDLRPHWVFFAKQLLAGVPVFALLFLALQLEGDLITPVARIAAASVTIVWAGWLALRLVRWQTTHIVVTSERLIVRRGLLAKFGREIPLERVNDITFHQSIVERVLGAGDLLIESGGERGQESFSAVPHPDRVQQEIYRQMEAQWERRYGGVPRPGAGASAGVRSIPQQIAELAELRDRGLISPEEFEAKKTELLGRM